MSEFGGLWKHENNHHALVPPKTDCGCPSGGGIKNGDIRYPCYGGTQKKERKKDRQKNILSLVLNAQETKDQIKAVWVAAQKQATLGYYNICPNTIYSLLAFSEIRGKITHGKKPRTQILSKKNKKSNISSLAFFISPSVRSLTSADYCANLLTHNTTVPAAGISPKRETPLRLPIWHQSSHLACNSNQKNQTDSKLE